MTKPAARDITCEVCDYTFSRVAWEENQGYCPNCDQPIGKMAREALNLPRTDMPEEEPPESGVSEDPLRPDSPEE